MTFTRIPCRIIRGGTSKGVFFHEHALPRTPSARDRAILAAFGSAERRQIDGLGGADPLTSKVALLRPARRADADVDYICGQVGIGVPTIDYSLNCGNLAAGAALFAVDEGLVARGGRRTTLRIFNPPTRTTCIATLGDLDDRDGGAAATGAAVELRFPSAAGAATGALLPTGAGTDRITLRDGRAVEVSVVDTGNVYAFVAAADLGLAGNESPETIEHDARIVAAARDILVASTVLLRERSAVPFDVRRLALISPPLEAGGAIDLLGRILTAEGRGHKAFAVTGAIATAFAAFLDDSIVRRLMPRDPGSVVRIAHPEGTIAVGVECGTRRGRRAPTVAVIHRTARCLLDGWVHVPTAPVAEEHAAATGLESPVTEASLP
ncbi:MAG: PrpF domain-containing protein [Candidatus Binatia bacterium]